VISRAYLGAIQANIFDGKSDGKNPFGILVPKFTVRNVFSRRRKRLQNEVCAQLMIAWLGE
jgi:hypothetical protein